MKNSSQCVRLRTIPDRMNPAAHRRRSTYLEFVKFIVERLGGHCPAQADGHLDDGRPFYFGARGGDWSIFIGPQGAATDGDWVGLAEYLFAVGDDPTGGRMTEDQIRATLEMAFEVEPR